MNPESPIDVQPAEVERPGLAESPLRYMAEISFHLDQTAFAPAEREAIDRKLTQLDVRALRATNSLLQRLNPEQIEALLHPHEVSGPLLILAGAGSGKTTVLTRRVAYLLACGVPEESIFAVTFTRKAAGEMAERLEKLLSAELPARFFDVGKLWISTFHSACTRILRESVFGMPNIVRLGYKHQRFTAIDERAQLELMRRILADIPGAAEYYTAGRVLEEISDAKQRLIGAPQFAESGEDQDPARRLTRAYLDYQKALVARNALDFDDMILLTVYLLETDQAVREHYQSRFRHLLIDEYQDTNLAQYRLARLLVGDKNELFVVGDDDQSIYGFRGADIRNILEFRKDYPGSKIVKLETNYRSSHEIIASANNVFHKSDPSLQKTLRVGRRDADHEHSGGPILHYADASDERDEAEFVAEEIQIERGKGKPLQDFAVLYRVNVQAEPFCNVFESYAIPYEVAGGRILDHEVVQDVVALLQLVDFDLRLRNRDIDARRVQDAHNLFLRLLLVRDTRFRFDTKTFQMVQHWYSQKEWRCPQCLGFLRQADQTPCPHCRERFDGAMPGMSGYEALTYHAERYPGYRRRFERQGTWEHMDRLLKLVQELASAADDYDMGELVEIALAEWGLSTHLRVALDPEAQERYQRLEAFVELAFDFDRQFSESLETQAQGKLRSFLRYLVEPAGERDRVTLSTLHSAKGLEWPTVFYAGLEDDLSPHAPRAQPGKSLTLAEIRRQYEEEERLFYVGITRARDVLYLTHASERRLYTKRVRNSPSPFLGRIPRELLQKKRRTAARQSALAAGIQRTAALLDERHKRRRVLEILETERAERQIEQAALSIEPRPLEGAGRSPGCILAYPDPPGLVAAAQLLRALPHAELRFAYPADLAAEIFTFAERSASLHTLVVAGMPLHDEQLDAVIPALQEIAKRDAPLLWYDHHPWSEHALQAVHSVAEDVLVRPEVGTTARIVSLRLLPGDELADRMARLLADRLAPAEEEWGLRWACLLQELSSRRFSGKRRNSRRRSEALRMLAEDRPLGLRERLEVRRNIERRFLGDEIARLAHREEFTEQGRKFLVIDLRPLHSEVSALGQRHVVLLVRRPAAPQLARQACKRHAADFALCVHDAERYSLHRRADSLVDLRPLLELHTLEEHLVQADGHEDTVGVRCNLPWATRWRSRFRLRLPPAAELLIGEIRARL
jgi:ATP-dependent DNA helicase UvrD/PcrA